MTWRINSLEAQLKLSFAACLLLQLVCCGFLLLIFSWWKITIAGFSLLLINAYLYRRVQEKIFASFRRASVQLEALQNQDYSLVAKPAFSGGKVAEFHQQLNALGESLQQHKSDYDQQLFLLYRLIDQLNTPILVFDHRLQLNYANAAFAELFGRPWKTLRHASPSLLGLLAEPQWQFVDANKTQQWQIRTSRFLDQGQNHQLLVFINIQAALRESQLEAWQKLIRVLSHEIRNSLTPVAALTQSLQNKVGGEREQQALELIGERCQHLQDFVSRYAELHKPLHMEPQWLNAESLFQRLQALFPEAQLQAKGLQVKLWTDSVFLQQVLINLIKNAVEAGSPAGTIEIQFNQREQVFEIMVVDRGHGISNPDNLFVPFYSTKTQGQGIGLSVSRHIVEQMGGQLSLSNNSQGTGACAIVQLHY
ncbi:sensor histidine kinase [Cellvibrio zantedeschiae]|uniref:histidine kinase n=1 Tax=Cellvibrio zantedeschiae TaxID=1237077 RepID=A0ABQ3B2P2_9GAMM|nr:ATP-binding protein [Cellvibrio zantedeschiae]GGY74735.1 sensor histidine kinase [Cellvibrio zantedeschiae]